jgi:hypothetical protein
VATTTAIVSGSEKAEGNQHHGSTEDREDLLSDATIGDKSGGVLPSLMNNPHVRTVLPFLSLKT